MPGTSKRMKALARYVIAIGGVVLAWLLREALTPVWGPTALPFIFFFPAIVLAAWYGRARLAILSIGLSTVLANYFFVEPRRSLWISNPAELIGLIEEAGFEAVERDTVYNRIKKAAIA